jgi:hypothetical protein
MNGTLLTKNEYIEIKKKKNLVSCTKVEFSLCLAHIQYFPSFISVAIIMYSDRKQPKGERVYFGV